MEDQLKKISISGTNNRYQIKKLFTPSDVIHKQRRTNSINWDEHPEIYTHSKQIQVIHDMSNNHCVNIDDITQIFIQEIGKKISGYKQQDKLKKRYDEEKFITFQSVIEKMCVCDLKCRYCKKDMLVIYDIMRESKQWSVDRVDNDIGHNINNFHLACLECNLSRRRRTDAHFLFTKQLTIIKREI